MSDTLTLLTADDPPVSLTASRTALAANSKVFADMLSVPVGDKASEPVVVAETQEQIEPFLRLLEGQAPALSSPQWEVLARLGDKYDSFVAQQAVDARGWELEAKNEEPLHAFTLATTTGNKDLLDCSALRAIRVSDRSKLGADDVWRQRLDNLEAKRIATAVRLLKALASEMKPWSHQYTCTKPEECRTLTASVPAFVGTVLMGFDLSAPALPLIVNLPAPRACGYGSFKLMCAQHELRWKRSAPQFSQIR